jgi:nickel-dependent lactate racemase
VKPGESVCFVVSDSTRKAATDRILPMLIEELGRAGCRVDDMHVLVATGVHRPPTEEELRAILSPPVAGMLHARIRVHDADDEANLVLVGTTRRGHPVRINRLAVACNRLILIGTATYHYHAGFGGGRKSLVPGIAARRTIAFNHSLTLDPAADRIHPDVRVGVLDGNPVAEEMLESARFCPPDLIVNTVLSPAGKLIGVFAGDMDMAHRTACRMVEQTCRVVIDEPADLVVASAIGAPNWIQSHKALFNAHRAMAAGGRIVLMAPCPEGVGDERFRYWVRKPTLDAIYAELRVSPDVNGQTALSTRTRGAAAILVTELPDADVSELGMRRAASVNAALERAVAELRERGIDRPSCLLMPDARYTVPFDRGDDERPARVR